MSLPDLASPRANEPKRITLTLRPTDGQVSTSDVVAGTVGNGTEQPDGSRRQRAARHRGLPLGRVDAPHLPRGPVHLLDSSPDTNRTAAVAGARPARSSGG